MGSFVRVCAAIRPGDEEALALELGGLPVLGCEIGAVADGRSPVFVYLERGAAASVGEVEAILGRLGAVAVRTDEVEERDWLATHRQLARPFEVGSTWFVDPHPDHPSAPPSGRTRLAVEPRDAFGSGSHASTRLVLLELETIDLGGARVLDVGTGSGILAFAATARGAREVVAIDIDARAVFVARESLADQGPELPVLLAVGPLRALAVTPFDLVLCNMIPAHFGPMLDGLGARLGEHGEAILSGILADQREAVTGELDAVGLRVARERRLEEWIALVAVRA